MASTTPLNPPPGDIVAEVEALGERLSLVRERIGEVIFGQREVIEQALITLLSGGHALLIGVPGLAKTRLVETLGTILGVDDKRIQCTPDLMPADILGSEVLEESESGRRSFRFLPGPVFCQLLMADEINRASPRTQSALLAGDAGGPGVDRRAVPPAAAPVPCAGDAEPAGAGGHLPAARGAARPLPAADRRRLPRPRFRAAHADRHHRPRRDPAARGDDRRRTDRGAAAGPAHPGRRQRRRCDPQAGALRTAGGRRRRARAALSPGGRGRAPARR